MNHNHGSDSFETRTTFYIFGKEATLYIVHGGLYLKGRYLLIHIITSYFLCNEALKCKESIQLQT